MALVPVVPVEMAMMGSSLKTTDILPVPLAPMVQWHRSERMQACIMPKTTQDCAMPGEAGCTSAGMAEYNSESSFSCQRAGGNGVFT